MHLPLRCKRRSLFGQFRFVNLGQRLRIGLPRCQFVKLGRLGGSRLPGQRGGVGNDLLLDHQQVHLLPRFSGLLRRRSGIQMIDFNKVNRGAPHPGTIVGVVIRRLRVVGHDLVVLEIQLREVQGIFGPRFVVGSELGFEDGCPLGVAQAMIDYPHLRQPEVIAGDDLEWNRIGPC